MRIQILILGFKGYTILLFLPRYPTGLVLLYSDHFNESLVLYSAL